MTGPLRDLLRSFWQDDDNRQMINDLIIKDMIDEFHRKGIVVT